MFASLKYLAFFLSLSAYAAGPAIDSVGGASSYNTTGTITVFGGLAGEPCIGTINTSTCSSCATISATTPNCTDPSLCMCNENRIWDGLTVRVNLKPEANSTLNAVAQIGSGGSINTNFPPITTNNGGSFVDFRWTDICNAAGSSGGCSQAGLPSGGSVVIRIAIDKDKGGSISTGEEPVEVTFKILNPPAPTYEIAGTEGIAAFNLHPGDEKVYVEDPEPAAGSNYPYLNYGSTRARAVRVFYADTALADAAPPSTQFVDLPLTDDGEKLDVNVVRDLENDKLYFFRIALLDEAGNVILYFPPKSEDATCTTSACIYSATPSEVLGLLSKDFNCFVATAAYGTTLEPKLQVFRDFRYKILLQNSHGLKFVKWYYKYGPFAARYIYDKPVLRAVTRGLLWPLYGFSYLALKLGFSLAFALSLALLTSAIALPWFGLQRVLKRE